MDCSLRGSSVHGISQQRMLEWAYISFSRGSSRPGDRMHVSRLLHWQADSLPLSHLGRLLVALGCCYSPHIEKRTKLELVSLPRVRELQISPCPKTVKKKVVNKSNQQLKLTLSKDCKLRLLIKKKLCITLTLHGFFLLCLKRVYIVSVFQFFIKNVFTETYFRWRLCRAFVHDACFLPQPSAVPYSP